MGNSTTTAIKFGWIKEVWNFRELFYFFIWRDIKIRYKQTVLGALWAIIQPFFTMVVFTIFFGNFAKVPSEGVPYPVFSYSALVPWTYFSGALGSFRKQSHRKFQPPHESVFPKVCNSGVGCIVWHTRLLYCFHPFIRDHDILSHSFESGFVIMAGLGHPFDIPCTWTRDDIIFIKREV